MIGPDAPIGPQVIKQTHLPARLNQQLVGVQYRSARSLRPAVACRALLHSQEFRQLGHIGRDPPDVVSAFSGRAGGRRSLKWFDFALASLVAADRLYGKQGGSKCQRSRFKLQLVTTEIGGRYSIKTSHFAIEPVLGMYESIVTPTIRIMWWSGAKPQILRSHAKLWAVQISEAPCKRLACWNRLKFTCWPPAAQSWRQRC